MVTLTQRPTTPPLTTSRLFITALPENESPEASAAGEDSLRPSPARKSLGSRFMEYFRGPKDGLSFKQRLAKYGLAVVLSYGAVSNVSGCISVSIAWFISCKRNLVSPLAPGQYKSFLAVYAGFFVFLNVIRPLRFAFSIAISPVFDRMINGFQRRFSLSRTAAIALSVFIVNVLGSIAVLVTGVSLASLASGVPIFPIPPIAAKPY
jgi:hypothetical protein